MFKTLSFGLLLLSVCTGAYGHAAVAPQLGVGTPSRATVLRPSNNNPCGAGVNIAGTFDSSQAITANGNTFTAAVTNFNGGADGSRRVSVRIDPTGTGKNFQAATVVTNGNAAPRSNAAENVVVRLPAACTGGATRNKCLAAFTTTAGFGNCVVVQQGAANRAAQNGAASNQTANGSNRAAGTRAARAARAAELLEIEEEEEHDDSDSE